MLKHDLKVGQKSQKIRHLKNAPLNFAATFQEGLVSMYSKARLNP